MMVGHVVDRFDVDIVQSKGNGNYVFGGRLADRPFEGLENNQRNHKDDGD